MDEERSAAASSWNVLIGAAGAAAGLAAFVYVVGAATLWIRFWHAGFPPDAAIAHLPYQAAIGLGVRDILWVSMLTLCGLLPALALHHLKRGATPTTRAGRWWATVSQRRIVTYMTSHRMPTAVTAAVLLIVTASLFRWRAFGIAILIVACFVAIHIRREHRGRTHLDRDYRLLAGGIALLAAAIAAITWGFDANATVQGVRLFPPDATTRVVTGTGDKDLDGLFPVPPPETPSEPYANEAPVPYFGETSSYVYVEETQPIHAPTPNGLAMSATRQIVEVPRQKVALAFVPHPYHLYQNPTPPGQLAVEWATAEAAQWWAWATDWDY